MYDYTRDTLTRLTSDPAADLSPVWTPDGRRIAFGSNRAGQATNLYWQRADGTGQAERLTTSTQPQLPDSFHPSGHFLAYREGDPAQRQQKIGVLPLEGSEDAGWTPGSPTVFASGEGIMANGRFSPDGKWLAFASAQSGRVEIYVQGFPAGGGPDAGLEQRGQPSDVVTDRARALLRPRRGRHPVDRGAVLGGWRHVQPRPSRSVVEHSIFRPAAARHVRPRRDIHPDGQRFAVAPPVPVAPAGGGENRVVFVLNFFDELKRLVPAK